MTPSPSTMSCVPCQSPKKPRNARSTSRATHLPPDAGSGSTPTPPEAPIATGEAAGQCCSPATGPSTSTAPRTEAGPLPCPSESAHLCSMCHFVTNHHLCIVVGQDVFFVCKLPGKSHQCVPGYCSSPPKFSKCALPSVFECSSPSLHQCMYVLFISTSGFLFLSAVSLGVVLKGKTASVLYFSRFPLSFCLCLRVALFVPIFATPWGCVNHTISSFK